MELYDPYMPEIKEDPYPVYRRLRAEAPVYYMEKWNAWALARFEDIWEASQDAVHLSAQNGTAERAFLAAETANFETLNSTDPPRHTQLRKKLFPLFGPKAARAFEQEIRACATACLDRHAETGRIDAVQELASQVAVRVAGHVSGFPREDSDYLVDLVRRFFRREAGTDGQSEAGRAAQEEMWTYLATLAERRLKQEPRADAIGVFMSESDERGPFDAERVARQMTLFLVGATETFPKVFATGLLRLWQHPDQRRALAADPGFIPTALDEILRYDMPTQWLGRTVIRDHEFRGQKFRAGQPVIFLYPSGNRDELEFEQPDVFDIQRRPERILTFGHGVHRCLGSFFARMEGKVLYEELLRRFPEYEVLEDELVREPTEFVQGYASFPIALV
jgi:cytochrome P450